MNEAVKDKFRRATAKYDLTPEQKRALVEWYADEFDDIAQTPQAQFNLLVADWVKRLG